MKLFDMSISPEEQQLAWYVDREVVLDDIAKRLRWEPKAVSKVVVYHGPGGIGKTSVRKMAESRLLRPAQIPYVVIDFGPDSGPHSAEGTFGYMRRQLGKFGLRFPAFDLVWARHWEETTQQRVSRTIFPAELEDAADILSIIPILGNIPQAIAAIAKLSQSAPQWLSQRFGKGGIARLQQMNALELVQTMPEAIARDLEESVEDEQYRGTDGDARITIVFDGFERLDEYGIDDWFVRKFCQSTSSTLKVIFGREPLKWERYHPDWRKVVDHHPALSNLKPNDSTEYLNRRGVNDQDLNPYLVELTGGLPYYLQLAADVCGKVEETEGREPTAADFANSEHTTDLGETLLSSLLRQLEKDEYDVAMLVSIPRWFTEEIIELLVAEPASAPRLFRTLIRFSFCESMPDLQGAYILRKEARNLLRDRARKLVHWRSWNRRLYDYHSQHHSKLLHLAEEIYHGLIVDPDSTLKLFYTEFYRLLNTWQFGDCWTLMQAVPPESELPQNVVYRLTLARVALLQESWESKETLISAQKLVDSLLEKDLPSAIDGRAIRLAALVDIKLGNRRKGLEGLRQAMATFDANDLHLKAGTLRDLGDLYFAMGDFQHAVESHEEAISVLKDIEANSDKSLSSESQLETGARIVGLTLGDSLRAVASLYARTGRTQLAAKPLEEMLDEGQRQGNIRTQAEALSELGLIYRRLGRLSEAENAYRQALPLMEEFRVTGGKAHVLCGLGMALEQGGNFEAARPYFEQSLRLFEDIGDTYGQAKLWHCIARVDHQDQNYDLALNLYTRSLQLYREIKHIANTGSILLDIARLKATLGQTSEAVSLCEEAVEVFQGLQDPVASAATHTNMGLIIGFLQGNRALAVKHWQQARAAYKEIISSQTQNAEPPSHEQGVAVTTIKIKHLWVNWLSMYDPSAQMHTLTHLNTIISTWDAALAHGEEES